ncbi:MAG: AMP-binding protein [Actinobacteria bacterium]|nr:AMP-binding protein [Actinomycetota bacterium]
MLFPALADPPAKVAVRVDGRELDYAELRAAALAVAAAVAGLERVAVWAEPELETAVAVVGALLAGVPVVPVNPKAGELELGHVVSDSAPGALLARPGAALAPALDRVPRVDVATGGVTATADLPAAPGEGAPAIVLYTSGTTGPPKGAVLPVRAIASNLDALADAWAWTDADVVVHALPLFHAHGLVLGTLGPLRRGGAVHHVGRFSPESIAAALEDGGTMLFSVPTMVNRLATAAETDPAVAAALHGARLLVSGSAALPAREHERMAQATGRRVVERYGLSETLMNCSIRVDGDPRPGTVGPPLTGVELRLVDDDGIELDARDDATIGEVEVRGPNVFLGYLNRADATAEAMRDGWFRTGDLATRSEDGFIRIVGRKATDLIKTGGYKVGAGEVEGALLEHPAVAEAAVTAEPDDDLGERIVAWVVPAEGVEVEAGELADHVARLLTPHKRPRVVHFLTELPRNEMGKVQKRKLG